MGEPEDKHGQAFLDQLRQDQRNILPPDIIRNDRKTDDVFWHGPREGSTVQKVGLVLWGGLLLLGALSITNIIWQKGPWLGCVPACVIGAFGARILYKAFRPTNKNRASTK